MAFVKEVGHCDPDCFNSEDGKFIVCVDATEATEETPATPAECKIGNCFNGKFTIPGGENGTPIKTLLKGSSNAPWVKLWFETNCCVTKIPPDPPGCNPDNDCIPTDQTLITTGNISQPGSDEACKASIQAFQYSWGGVTAGNTCKITIHDESGGSFNQWFKRLARNPVGASLNTGQGVYKMKVQWGWLVTGTDDQMCPAMSDEDEDVSCSSPDTPGKPVMVCSPCLWFLPTNITCNFQNGRFIYELEGQDLLMVAANTPARKIFGGSPTDPDSAGQEKETYFVDAVVALGRISQPPFNVEFLQLPESPDAANPDLPTKLQFHVQDNQIDQVGITYATPLNPSDIPEWEACLDGSGGVIPCPGGELTSSVAVLRDRGPLGVWDTMGRNPMAAIQSWLMQAVRAHTAQDQRQGKGITINYDSTTRDRQTGCTEVGTNKNEVVHGKAVLWANAFPTCQAENQVFADRLKALYIVNGGSCSPVLSFTPNIKWNFTAAMSAGGHANSGSGQMQGSRENIRFNNCPVFGEAPRGEVVASNNVLDRHGQSAGRESIFSAAEHLRANYLHNSIEAELKVQGDPARWLCSPLFGYGRTVAIMMINPFFLEDSEEDPNSCPQFQNALVAGSSLQYKSSCNEVLSNRNWFIKGVDHQIKSGSYITTLKVFLVNPGSDFGGRAQTPQSEEPMLLSGDPAQSNNLFLCGQGTYTCTDKIVVGGQDVMPGMNTFCAEVCDSDLYVT